jgi:hypothetical protein
MVVNCDAEVTWVEAVVAYFRAMLHYILMAEGTEENRRIYFSVYVTSNPRINYRHP